MGGLPSARTRWLVTLLAPVVVLGGLELGLRLAGFEHPSVVLPIVAFEPGVGRGARDGQDLHRFDEASLWSPRPGARVSDRFPEWVNEAGYRGPPVPLAPPPGVLRVAFLGESNVFGLQVPFGESLAGRTRQLLAAGGARCDVVNGGVLGFTACQALPRWRGLVSGLSPHVVVIGFGTVNEHNPARGLSDLDRLAELAAGPDRLSLLALAVRQHLRLAHLAAWLGSDEPTPPDAARGAADEEHAGVGSPDWEGLRRATPDEFEACLEGLVDAIQADGAAVVLLSLPRLPELEEPRPVLAEYSERIARLAARRGLPLVDARARFLDAAASGTDTHAWYLGGHGWHLAAAGHEQLTRWLAPVVLAAAGSRTGPR